MVKGRRVRLLSVHLSDVVVERLDWLVSEGWFPNRSEAVRYAIVTLLREFSLQERDRDFRRFVDELVAVKNLLRRVEEKLERVKK